MTIEMAYFCCFCQNFIIFFETKTNMENYGMEFLVIFELWKCKSNQLNWNKMKMIQKISWLLSWRNAKKKLCPWWWCLTNCWLNKNTERETRTPFFSILWITFGTMIFCLFVMHTIQQLFLAAPFSLNFTDFCHW